jgi:hypothetical protein
MKHTPPSSQIYGHTMFPSHLILVTEIIWAQIVHTLNVSNITLKFKLAVMLLNH